MLQINPCIDCLLDRNTYETTGTPDGKFLLVVNPPKYRDQSLIPGHVFNLFKRTIQYCGLFIDDFVIHPYVRCAFNRDVYDTKEKKLIEAQCYHYLSMVINKLKPKLGH